MRRNRPQVHFSILLVAAAFAAGCASAQRSRGPAVAPAVAVAPRPASVPSAASSAERHALFDKCQAARDKSSPRIDPHEDLDAILWQQTSAEYQANTTTVYRAAAAALQGLVGTTPAEKAVVVFDLDETILDNSRFQGRAMLEARKWDAALWDCWVGQKQALRVAGAELLFGAMAAQKVRGRFITNRSCSQRAGGSAACPQKAETLENLNALLADTGYVATADELLLSGDKDPRTGTNWEDEKKPRRDFVSTAHTIVMLVGDDLGDFVEGVRQATRAERIEAFAKARDRWGTRWFLLPNPSYGSWTSAVDRQTTPAGKRPEVVEGFAYPKE